MQSVIQLMEDEERNIAFAAKNLNPFITYIKFVLTDDLPNGNNQRVPQSEFASLISSGIFMPIKMALGRIEQGHDNASAVGVIVGLKHVDNKIVGTAVLWEDEREADVALIKKRYADGEEINLSWELVHADSSIDEETGVQDLLGCMLLATTIVDSPAYMGRTQITEVEASTTQTTEDKTVMDEKEIKALQESHAEQAVTIAGLTEEVEALRENQVTPEIEAELTELRDFKAESDAERVAAEKLDAIVTKFAEAGVETGDTYFADNKDMLLAFEDKALDFMIAQLVASQKTEETPSGEEEKEEASITPNIPNDDKPSGKEDKLNAIQLAKAFKKAE